MNMYAKEPRYADLPREVGLFPLAGVLLLPRGQVPIQVFEPRYLTLVDWALASGRMIGLVQPSAPGKTGTSAPDDAPLRAIGCLGRLTGFEEQDDGRVQITLKGVARFVLGAELPLLSGFRRAIADYAPFRADLGADESAVIDRPRVMRGLKSFLGRRGVSANWEALDSMPAEALVSLAAMLTPFEPEDKQALLEAPDVAQRAKVLIGLMEADLLGEAAASARH